MPSLLEKADLMYGFDLTWREAVRLHLGLAGVTGRMWLVADASLGSDPLRVRLGPLVGELVNLSDFGIGQGRRGAVHMFGTLVRGLISEVEGASVGAGLDTY